MNISGVPILAIIAFGFILFLCIATRSQRRMHNKKCNGILYRSITFNGISNVKCTKCDYNEDTILPPSKSWRDVDEEARKKEISEMK
jgi:hypothetical protein